MFPGETAPLQILSYPELPVCVVWMSQTWADCGSSWVSRFPKSLSRAALQQGQCPGTAPLGSWKQRSSRITAQDLPSTLSTPCASLSIPSPGHCPAWESSGQLDRVSPWCWYVAVSYIITFLSLLARIPPEGMVWDMDMDLHHHSSAQELIHVVLSHGKCPSCPPQSCSLDETRSGEAPQQRGILGSFSPSLLSPGMRPRPRAAAR